MSYKQRSSKRHFSSSDCLPDCPHSPFSPASANKSVLLYKKLTTMGPQDAETWFRLGNIYARTKKPQIAQESYLKSLALKDTDPRTWNNLGIVMLRQAWLAMVQAKIISEAGDPAFENTAVIIKTLETLPAIASEKTK